MIGGLTASTGPIWPSTIRRRKWTNASWFSAWLILRPKSATFAPYFWASCRSWKASRVVPGRTAEDADDQVRIEPDQLFHRLRAVVDDLEEQRPAGRADTREHPGDHVVEVVRAGSSGATAPGDVGVEDLEEVAEALALGLLAELVESLEGREVALEIVVERHAVQAEVRRRATAPRARSRGGRTGRGRGWRSGTAARGLGA